MSTAIGQAAAAELNKVAGVSIPPEAFEAIGALLVDVFTQAGWKRVDQVIANATAEITTVEQANKELAK